MSFIIFHKRLLLIIFIVSSSFSNLLKAQEYHFKTVCIDAGHGGHDGSTRGEFSKEKDVALTVALALGQKIEKEIKGVKVIYTRTEDVFIPLSERIEFANRNKADLFISIHCNSMPISSIRKVAYYKKGKKGKKIPVYTTTRVQSTGTRGVETFLGRIGRIDEQDDLLMRENSTMFMEENKKAEDSSPENEILLSVMKNTYRQQSLNFANILQQEYVQSGRINRGVKEKGLEVLAKATMPAVLTEIGFISNPEEEEYINSQEGRNTICNNMVDAIEKFKNLVETGKAGAINVVKEAKVDSLKTEQEDNNSSGN